MTDLNLSQLRRVGVARSERWHADGLTEWSALEWAGAMAGEAGEACNVAKKIRRLELGAAARGSETDMAHLLEELGDECADTLIYLDLLAARHGIDLAAAVVRKFNRTSETFGFPERLTADKQTLTLKVDASAAVALMRECVANGPRYGVTDEVERPITRPVLAWFVERQAADTFATAAGLHVVDLVGDPTCGLTGQADEHLRLDDEIES